MPTCPAGHESQASDYCDTCGLVIGGASGPGTAAQAAPATAPAAAPAAGPGPRAGCPVCGAGRDGRFCEECGYDFELAEAMPETVLTPGIGPAETQAPDASRPAPEAESAAAQTSTAPVGEPGFDLEAELARAEAQAARAGSGTEPAATEPLPTAPPVPSAGDGLFEAPASGPDLVREAFGPALPAEELVLIVNADREYYAAQVERGDIVESEFPFPKYPAERRFSFAADAGPVRIGRASASRGLNPEIDLTGPPLDPAVSHLHAQLIKHDEGWVVVDLGSANGTRLNDSAEPLEAETEIPVKRGDRIHLGVWTTIVVQ
jgi:hypothetical protein